MAEAAPPAHRPVVWPPCLRSPSAPLSKVVDGLMRAQAEAPETIRAGQAAQAARMLAWAVDHSDYYAELAGAAAELADLAAAPDRFFGAWRALPLLRKVDLRTDAGRIYATGLPRSHGPLSMSVTSGSTGTPVEVRMTRLTRLAFRALTVREHLWQGRDVGKRLGAVRYVDRSLRDPRGIRGANWGPPVAELWPTAPSSVIHVGLPLEDIARWLEDFDPAYLLCNPSLVAGLMDVMAQPPPALEQVRCMFEPLDPALEAAIAERWQVGVTDAYSANELGIIAVRCAEAGTLHVQEESALVEVLDEHGAPAAPGDWGSVVVTPLLNLATPLVRYETGDYATVGEPCACGRPSATLGRVLGRVRNLARRPDGSRFWPTRLNILRHVAPVLQAQFVQTALDRIELRVVVSRPLDDADRAAAIARVREALEYDYVVEVAEVEALERGPTGKFEEFVSQLDE